MKIKSRIIALTILTTLTLTGCASFEMTKPAPEQEAPIEINFTGEHVYGRLSLPTNIHTVPNSNALISGSQTSSALWFAFGPAGILAKTAIESNAAQRESTSIIAPLQIDLKEESTKIKNRLALTEDFRNQFSISSKTNQPNIDVASNLIFSFENEKEAKIYLVLKAELKTIKTGKPVWSTRYISSSEQRPITGSNSWSENDGQALKKAIAKNLEKTIHVMMTDISTPYARRDSNLIAVQGKFLLVPAPIQILAYKLTESSDSILFIPKTGDAALFSGINITDKEEISYRPARKNDPIYIPIPDSRK